MKTTQELLEDLARRSGSPTIATRTETQPIPAAGSPNVRPWQDEACQAKEELMAKFLQSQTVAPSSKPNHRPAAVRTKIDDAVADILAKLPPLDPSLAVEVAQWTEQTAEDQVDSAESPVGRPPVCSFQIGKIPIIFLLLINICYICYYRFIPDNFAIFNRTFFILLLNCHTFFFIKMFKNFKMYKF